MLVVGLGNPGGRYASTRHNIGFAVVDQLFAQCGGGKWKTKYKGDYSDVSVGYKTLKLLKPKTYMNHSGKAVLAAMSGLKLAPTRVMVVHDELDLPFGTLRLKVGGGHGGNNGIRSILEHIGDQPFVRLRFGIGHPGKGADVTSYVLSGFSPEEKMQLPALLFRATDVVEDWVAHDVQHAMQSLHTDELAGSTD